MKKMIGMFAAMALTASGMALAQGTTTSGATGSTAAPSNSGMGTTSSSPTATRDAAGQELTGKVLKSSGKTLYLEHMGAVIPLKVDSKTEFSDASIHNARDFKQGQEIRASYLVKDTDNVATRISMDSEKGLGGSGPDTSVPNRDYRSDPGIGMKRPSELPDTNRPMKPGSIRDRTTPDVNDSSDLQVPTHTPTP